MTILIILGMKRITRKIPGALIAVIGMIILSWALNLQAKGVAVLGPVPGGLPKLGLPQRPVEFWVALITAATVIFIGVEQGILLAVLLALVVHTRHGYRSKNTVLVDQAGHLRPVPMTQAAQALPGLMLYRFNHSMYYANSDLLATQVLELLKTGPDPVAWLCIDMIAVDDVDFSAAAALRQAYKELNTQDARLVFAEASDHVRAELERSGIVDLVGQDAFFDDTFDVIEAYRKAVKKQTGGTVQ